MIKKKKESNLNVLLLLVTMVASALLWPCIYILYRGLKAQISLPVVIGIGFAALAAVVIVAVLCMGAVMQTFRANIITGKSDKGMLFMLIVASVCVLFLLAALFQYIYQQNFEKQVSRTNDVIFLMDDSGSMQNNDPDGKRFGVIKEILEQQPEDSGYMIYSFADQVQLMQQLKTVKEGVPVLKGNSSGGTYIKAALSEAIGDYEQRERADQTDTMVVLITDGYASDIVFAFEISGLLRRFEKMDIPVSTVGIGNADGKLLETIANKTGGAYVDIENVDQLHSALETAVAAGNGTRDLLSARGGRSSWSHSVMRIVFVAILGVLISAIAMLCYGNSASCSLIMICGTVKAALGAILLETGIELLCLPESIVCFVVMVLVGTVVANYGNPGNDPGHRDRGEAVWINNREETSGGNAGSLRY